MVGDHIGGLAMVYRRGAGEWVLEDTLEPPPEYGSSSGFGYSVDVDGDAIVVGWPGTSAAFAYRFVAGSSDPWQLSGRLAEGLYTSFGTDVAISKDLILVGAPDHTPSGGQSRSGAAFVFKRTPSGSGWYSSPAGELEPTSVFASTNSDFGFSVDLVRVGASTLPDRPWGSFDIGGVYGIVLAVVGAPKTDIGAGVLINGGVQVSLLRNDGSDTTVESFMRSTDTSSSPFKFGYSVAMNSDGVLAVGSANRKVVLFEPTSEYLDGWGEVQAFATTGNPVESLSMSGDRLAVGFDGEPLLLYEKESSGWILRQAVTPPSGTFGLRVGIDRSTLTASSSETFVFDLLD